MTTTYHLDDRTVTLYAAALKMPRSLVVAWLHCEGQDDSQLSPNNALNIQHGNTPGQSGSRGVTGLYPTLEEGAHWTGWLIDNGPYAGVRAARASGDPYQIARAIELSPWAGSHYGASAAHNGCVSSQLVGAPAPKPPKSTGALDRALNPVPITAHRRVNLPAGTHLYEFPGAPIGDTLTELTPVGYVAATAEWLLVGIAGGDRLWWAPRHDPLAVDDVDLDVGI